MMCSSTDSHDQTRLCCPGMTPGLTTNDGCARFRGFKVPVVVVECASQRARLRPRREQAPGCSTCWQARPEVRLDRVVGAIACGNSSHCISTTDHPSPRSRRVMVMAVFTHCRRLIPFLLIMQGDDHHLAPCPARVACFGAYTLGAASRHTGPDTRHRSRGNPAGSIHFSAASLQLPPQLISYSPVTPALCCIRGQRLHRRVALRHPLLQ
jgi:hypothetical protein